jgi:hypothetical protein
MSDIQDLEQGIKDAEHLLERRQMALKLYDNREFRVLFVDGYFKDEAARLVQNSTEPKYDAQQRADSLAMAQATGHARRYLSMAVQMGAVAERELPQMHAMLEHLRALPEGEQFIDDDGAVE